MVDVNWGVLWRRRFRRGKPGLADRLMTICATAPHALRLARAQIADQAALHPIPQVLAEMVEIFFSFITTEPFAVTVFSRSRVGAWAGWLRPSARSAPRFPNSTAELSEATFILTQSSSN